MVTIKFILLTLDALGWSQVNCQPRLLHPHYISTFQIYLIDYSSQGFTKLKYSDTSTLIIWKGQSHLDPHIDFVSTWLYPVAFYHCFKNPDSSAPKHSELLASHYDDLKSEEYLYPCVSWAALDSRTLNGWVICSMTMCPYISPVCHPSVTTLLG